LNWAKKTNISATKLAILQFMNNALVCAKKQAGRRYLPGIKDGFPSLPIQSLIDAIDGMARNKVFWDRVEELRLQISLAQKDSPFITDNEILPKILNPSRNRYRRLVKDCLKIADDILRAKGSMQPLNFKILPSQTSRLNKASRALIEFVRNQQHSSDSAGISQSFKNKLESHILANLAYQNRQLYDALSAFISFAESKAAILSNRPYALLIGPPGSGKTHFLCDIARQRLSEGKPTLIYMARSLPIHNNNFWASLACAFPNPYSASNLLLHLQLLAKRSKERILIFIDAINEADRKAWEIFLKIVLNQVGSFPEIGIILSCRNPYQDFMISQRCRRKMLELWHPGFVGIEDKAQEVIFGAFQLPLPEVPLLANEFSNPLFLISFCETLHSTTIHQRHRKIKQLSSGQVGMTKIIEDFFKTKQKQISKSICTDFGENVFKVTAWLWGMGSNQGVVKDIALIMAKRLERYAFMDELDSAINKYVTNQCYVNEVRTQMLIQGVFIETIFWKNEQHVDAICINYQKFSDHLIIRSLLADIKLPGLKQLKTLHGRFRDEPGLLEALMMEIPVRIKRELLLLIPKKDVTINSMHAFISGLYWRSNETFIKETDNVVNMILQHSGLSNEMHEALVSLSTKVHHPYNANELDRYLNRYTLVNRDLIWSEYLRHCDQTSAPIKLVNWLLTTNLSNLPIDAASNYMKILQWLLTTTRRSMRDKVTKALVLLGCAFPSVIRDHAIASLKINDPYVSERMLAAVYGVWLRKLPTLAIDGIESNILFDTALQLYKEMFQPKSPYCTTHALTRDYARRTILCALQMNSNLLNRLQIKRITPPFKFEGIRKWGRSLDKNEGQYTRGNSPMHLDFGNYTLGRLIRNRSNYDFRSDEYKIVKENIFWRIYQLGYTLANFAAIDARIASIGEWEGQSNSEKVDRYGKKYCWIAYFELYGHRQDIGRLDDFRLDGTIERPGDCDVDPSFPGKPHTEPFDNSNYLGRQKFPITRYTNRQRIPKIAKLLLRDSIYGIVGPWVLLDYYIKQRNSETKRTFGMWIHTRIIEHRQLSLLSSLSYDSIDSARQFESTSHSSYAYAYEVPWADTWPYGLEDNLEFDNGWEYVCKRNEHIILYRKGKRLSNTESDQIFHDCILKAEGVDKVASMLKVLSDKGLRLRSLITEKKTRQRRQIKVRAENPVHGFCWESHHSDVNDLSYITLPSKRICNTLKLSMDIPNWDFIDSKGQKAIIVAKVGDESHEAQEAVYIRQDLIENYLNITKSHLIWSMSGERLSLYGDEYGQFQIPNEGKNTIRRFHRLLIYKAGGCQRLFNYFNQA
jgi:hypothetical protein